MEVTCKNVNKIKLKYYFSFAAISRIFVLALEINFIYNLYIIISCIFYSLHYLITHNSLKKIIIPGKF